jgi:hypothetical protein
MPPLSIAVRWHLLLQIHLTGFVFASGVKPVRRGTKSATVAAYGGFAYNFPPSPLDFGAYKRKLRR